MNAWQHLHGSHNPFDLLGTGQCICPFPQVGDGIASARHWLVDGECQGMHLSLANLLEQTPDAGEPIGDILMGQGQPDLRALGATRD